MAEQFEHIPVLLEPVLEYLTFPTNRPVRLIDGTLGGAGHSSKLLSLYSNLELLGIDRDDEALAAAKEKLSFAKDRVHLERGDYGNMKEIAAKVISDTFDKPTAIKLILEKEFYVAEDYHQDYALKNPKEIEEEFKISGRNYKK